MAAKHTPGPWFIVGKSIASRYRDEILAQVFRVSEDGGDLEANARLIAAAPELLEALEMAYAHIQTKLYLIRDADKETISSAIAKTKGEEDA